MIVSAIVATAKDRVIGKDNNIPWYLPADLKYFKKTTLNHHIIMGRKTFQSIGRPLPKRTNIVITRNPFFVASNCIITDSLENALEMAANNGEEEVFIIGGSQIYELAWKHLDRIYLTEVALETEGDTYFPKLEEQEWKLCSTDDHVSDEKNEYDYIFKVYERKSAD